MLVKLIIAIKLTLIVIIGGLIIINYLYVTK